MLDIFLSVLWGRRRGGKKSSSSCFLFQAVLWGAANSITGLQTKEMGLGTGIPGIRKVLDSTVWAHHCQADPGNREKRGKKESTVLRH